MPRRLVKILGWILGLLGLGVVLLWLVLSSSFFSGFRRSLAETALSEEIGQPLIVKDDVRIRLGWIARVYVAGVEIPSENIDGINLAELNLLELDINLVSLVQSKLEIDNLSVDGLLVNVTTQLGGTTSWTPAPDTNLTAKAGSDSTKATLQSEGSDSGILDFLSDKTASFTEIGLKINNQDTGFSFEFDLSSLLLEQRENGQLISLTSKGTVNGEAFSVDGNFPRGKPFTTEATFGDLRLDFDGLNAFLDAAWRIVGVSSGGSGWPVSGRREGLVQYGDMLFYTRVASHRSEERRVGKECRSRWSPYH